MKKDKTYKTFPPISFCPVPAWLSAGKCYSIESPTRLNGTTELFGYPLPKIETILSESYVVQHFMESAFSNSKKLNKNFWREIQGDCLVAKEARHILGSEWRVILLNE
jgi:hypothetical protein